MQVIKRTTIEISYASGEGPLVHSQQSYGSKQQWRIDSVEHETSCWPGDDEGIVTVSVTGRKVKADGTYPARVQYPEPLYGDEVDQAAVRILEANATEEST